MYQEEKLIIYFILMERKERNETNENPMNAHLTKLLDINGFLAILFNNIENVKPTPTPTPANTINGILDARYLKPSNIINDVIIYY